MKLTSTLGPRLAVAAGGAMVFPQQETCACQCRTQLGSIEGALSQNCTELYSRWTEKQTVVELVRREDAVKFRHRSLAYKCGPRLPLGATFRGRYCVQAPQSTWHSLGLVGLTSPLRLVHFLTTYRLQVHHYEPLAITPLYLCAMSPRRHPS